MTSCHFVLEKNASRFLLDNSQNAGHGVVGDDKKTAWSF